MAGRHFIAGITSIRIAMLSIHSSPIGPLGTKNTGGMSVYVREVAKWIGALGHTVDIFTSVPGPARPLDLYTNVRLIHLSSKGLAEIPKEDLFDHLPDVVEALEQYARSAKISYHMIHSHYWLSGVVGHMIQKQWDCPHLTMFHTLGRIKNRSTFGESEPERRLAHELRLVNAVDGIVVPAPGERDNLMDHYGAQPEKVYLIPCGVNMDRFKPIKKEQARLKLKSRLKIDGGTDMILFVGRFSVVKGLDMLLQAVADLVPRYPQVKLVVAGGDGPDADTTVALMERSEQLGISSHIGLAGRIDHNDLPFYYSAADLVTLPSSYESFGLVTLESMACGTPVAATSTGGAATIIREGLNGTLFERQESRCLSQGIERLLIHKRRQTLSASKIRESVAGFSWDRIAALILKTYYNLLGKE